MLGDCLFNIRSALDHIAVAIAPPERQDRASFPDHPRPENSDVRQKFRQLTEGMPPEAVAIIEAEHPYR